ncbi:fibrinogen-like protein 1 [Amphiura filiformis]|uniref:fibrinogen-like protein 1 n=1 Tax=Amphiura filiformis TaxID=82378 RepID=UPI003B21A80A
MIIMCGYVRIIFAISVLSIAITEGHDCYISDTSSSVTGQRHRQVTSPDATNEEQCSRLQLGGFNAFGVKVIPLLKTGSAGSTTTGPTTSQPDKTTSVPTSPPDKTTSVPITSKPPTTVGETTSSATTTKPLTTTRATTTMPMSTTPGPTPLSTVDNFEVAPNACPTLQADQSFGSCRAAYDAGYTTDGVYIVALSAGLYRAYCDMTNGGWMVMQRRVDGSQLFNLTRSEYEAGFGNLCKEFFWGHTILNLLFDDTPWNLRVTVVSFDGTSQSEDYSGFWIEKKANWHCHITQAGTGTAGDGLFTLEDKKFSTHDSDQDGDSDLNWAEEYQTGWWFDKDSPTPMISNPNGFYYKSGEPKPEWHGIIWVHDRSLMEIEMKIRYPLSAG